MNSALRKITVNLPAHLIEQAVELHGKNLTDTLRDALEGQKNRDAWAKIGEMRGKVDFGASWQELAGKYDED
ncbi:MAG: hypothetical protein JWM33_3755 [Caulobacteraceae bacterium]|nr:hypothetical protein [Caulobacteraceae bacterium]